MSGPTPDERRERIRLQLRRRLWVRRGMLGVCLLLGLSIVLDHARGLMRASAGGGDDWAAFERRPWAVEQQSASWPLRSSSEVNRRAAKNEWRRYWMVRSTLPFSLPRKGAHGCGAKW